MVGRGPGCIDVAHHGPELFPDFMRLLTSSRNLASSNKEAVIATKVGSMFPTPPMKIPDSNKSNGRSQSIGSSPKSRDSKNSTSPSSLLSDMLQQNSLNGLYAGAKFSEPPLATELPKPPSHWMKSVGRNGTVEAADCSVQELCAEMTTNLKVLLKVNS